VCLRTGFWGNRLVTLKREEVTGEWRILHNEEIHNFQSLPNIIRIMKFGKMSYNRTILYLLQTGDKRYKSKRKNKNEDRK
jgi:hypothetical protein